MWSTFVNHLNVFEAIFCFNWGEQSSPHMCNPAEVNKAVKDALARRGAVEGP